MSEQSRQSPTSPAATPVLLGAIVLGGLLLRLWSVGYGLPGVFNVDETPILNRALAFAKGDPNPRNFLYPTLHFYALFAWQGLHFAVGYALGWYESARQFQQQYFVDPSAHVVAGRALTGVLGAATIAAVYWFGALLYGRAVGLGAALLLAVAPLAVRDANYIKLDVPVAFFGVLAHAGLARLVVDPMRAARPRDWLLAGVLAGLAISTHYYAAFLAAPVLAIALTDIRRSGSWHTSARLLLWAGLGAAAGFMATSPFFVFEPAVVLRDWRELREVNIDRAIDVGPFSSLGPYLWLLLKSVGWSVLALAVAGAAIALARDVRRGLLLVALPVAYLAFVANTYPSSRYLNILLPIVAVAAAHGAWAFARLIGGNPAGTMAVICAAAALPPFVDSVRWLRFLDLDDTRIVAMRYLEREVPTGATILLQPYSAPIRQSREGLVEALRARLGDESRASVKFQFQLAATPAPPSYRVLYLGESGKGDGPPADPDKLYISPRAVSAATGLRPLHEARVAYVVLTRDGPTSPVFAPLVAELRRGATRVALCSPYRPGIDVDRPPVPAFRHNTYSWMDPSIARPGPIVEIWRIN